jgi:hypothetical protein
MSTNSVGAPTLTMNVVSNSTETSRQRLFFETTVGVFLFTLKFEVVNNLLILLFLFFVLMRKEIKIPKESIIYLTWLGIFLVPFFIFFNNFLYIKYLIYVIRLLIILFVANSIFSRNLGKKTLNTILDAIFFIHVLAILICFLSPTVNNVFRSLFSYSTGSSFRISGFIQGYEFVPYFVLINLGYHCIINKYNFSLYFLFKLLLGTFAVVLSGRFGLVPLAFFILALSIKTYDVKKLFLFAILSFAFSGVFSNQITNVKNTVDLLIAVVQNGDNIDGSSNLEEFDGQYNLSPMTFYHEFVKPFASWGSYLFPGPSDLVDSGPSYLALNFGFFVAILLYLIYFKCIKASTKLAVPNIIVMIVLLVDLKFRSIYTLFPAVWLILNHLNYKYSTPVVGPKG